MATYGAKHIKFAPFATSNPEPAASLPNYGAAVQLAELQKLTDNPQYNEGRQDGDDQVQEYVNEFKEADLDIEITDLENSICQVVLGAKATSVSGGTGDETHFNSDDIAPYGGLIAVISRIRHNVRTYQGIYYPKVKATMQGEEFATKGESITLAGGKLKFKAMACNNGDWKIKSPYMDTVDAAKAWCDAKLAAAQH